MSRLFTEVETRIPGCQGTLTQDSEVPEEAVLCEPVSLQAFGGWLAISLY